VDLLQPSAKHVVKTCAFRVLATKVVHAHGCTVGWEWGTRDKGDW
jgi:hypothetical protein